MSTASNTLPTSMRFIDIEQPGAPEVMRVAECALPELKPDEVLIKVAAAGINRADLNQREGSYPPPPDASPIMGLEAAGTLVALGKNVTTHKIGDRVCVLTHGGAYAEYVAAPAVLCLPIPQGFTMVEAASLPEAAMTVWSNLFMSAKLQRGDTVLIHGGTSGIGTCAIQFALAHGCKVIATAGSESKCAAIRELGADLAINYRHSDFVEEALKFTQKRGVDVVLDIVGGEYTARNIRTLAMDGRITQVSWQQGSKVTLDLVELSRRRGWLTGAFLRPRPIDQKQQIVDELKQHIWPLYSDGTLHPIVDKVYPYTQVIQAHKDMANSQHIGKLVLSFE